MNYAIIIYTMGQVLKLEAVCMLLPLICAVIYHEPCTPVFVVSAILCFVLGTIFALKKPKNRELFAKEGFIIVATSWIIISLFGALPFLMSGTIPKITDAVFESASGFTTTGASILYDVERLPRSILLWRSFTHWIGGMGVLVFLVAIFPLSGGSSFFLMKAESTGPSVGKLVPKLRTTAKLLYGMYIFFTILEIIFLLCGKMKLFEALTIAFGTAGTGGFGIRNSSAADYSAYLQTVITVFMVLFGVDFSFYFLLISRKFHSAFKMEEVRTYFAIIALSIAIITFNCRDIFGNISAALRHSSFQVASVITTTGFSTVDFDKWPALSKSVLLLLMFIGACAGSTGGGMKVSRHIILIKSIVKELKIAAHPKRTHKITFNGSPVSHETQRAVNVFLVSYFVIFALSVLIISIDNMNFETNFTAVAATLNNIGPGFAGVGPTRNFAVYSPLSKMVLTLDMLIGRLEIFPVLILFCPSTWKK